VRNVRRFRDSAKPRFTLDGHALRLENVPVPDPKLVTVSIDAEPFSYAGALLMNKLRAAYDRTRFAPRWTVTRAILDALREAAREHGAELLVAHFPSEPAAFGSRPEDSEILIDEWAGAHHAPVVRLREVFLNLPPAERADVFRGHFAPFGNLVVARAIARAIEGGRLLGATGSGAR
jgi:hypothetical protein